MREMLLLSGFDAGSEASRVAFASFIRSLFRREEARTRREINRAKVAIGLFSAVVSAMMGLGGPPLVHWLWP